MRGLVYVCVTALLVACSAKPTDEEIRAVLDQNVPQAVKGAAALDQLQSEQTVSGDEATVKFKAVLKTSEPLFVQVPFEEAAAAAGAKVGGAEQLTSAMQQLSPEGQEKFKQDIAKATEKPVFIKVATPAGTTSEWYGSFKTKKVVDKWLASDFKTDVDVKLPGQRKAAFSPGAVDVSQAKAWFADLQPKQDALLQRISDAKALEEKDAELTKQQAATAQERQAKEALISQQEKQARRLPLQVSFHKALLGNTLVMQIQTARPMTVRLDVSRGLQRFSKDVQLVPGRPVNIGHVEGWGFAVGDQVNLSNPSFDAASFLVR